MKAIAIMSCVLFPFGFLHAQPLRVEGHENPEVKANFARYKTFNVATLMEPNQYSRKYSACWFEPDQPTKVNHMDNGAESREINVDEGAVYWSDMTSSKPSWTNGDQVSDPYAGTQQYFEEYDGDGNPAAMDPPVSEATQSAIQHDVTLQMTDLGYRIDRTHPDVLVTFKMFVHPAVVTGFFGGSYSAPTSKAPGGGQDYRLPAGTLWVSVIDEHQQEAIWQGFVSGLNSNHGIILGVPPGLEDAIGQLFSKYNEAGITSVPATKQGR